jgi:hypothetical protein
MRYVILGYVIMVGVPALLASLYAASGFGVHRLGLREKLGAGLLTLLPMLISCIGAPFNKAFPIIPITPVRHILLDCCIGLACFHLSALVLFARWALIPGGILRKEASDTRQSIFGLSGLLSLGWCALTLLASDMMLMGTPGP